MAVQETQGEAPVTQTLPVARVPRRLSKPKWLDPRVLMGVLLVIAAMVVGAKVIGSARQTTGIWAAAGDLSAGTVVAATDLIRTEVNLGDLTNSYLDADQPIASGQVLNRAVVRGELIPISALETPTTEGRIVGVGVDRADMPPGVGHGSIIDLYLVTEAGNNGAAAKTELVAKQVTVQTVVAPTSGGLSGARTSGYQLVLWLPATVADGLVKTLPTGRPLVLLVTKPPR